ncbi:MAG: TIM barrel protein [Planctomycetes bacterium]|nr:TIM barrel protein [Planctomycetota bacterium]
MLKFAANLNFFYGGMPQSERFAAAARDGFRAVEFASPYDTEPAAIGAIVRNSGVTVSLFNAGIGEWDAGDRGLTALAGREADYRAQIDRVPEYCRELDCYRVNVMAGICPEKSTERGEAWHRFIENFRYAADTLKPHGITVLLEPINTYDIPGYFIATPAEGMAALQEVARDNVRLQYDIYHAQRMEGELTAFMRQHIDCIGYIQVADNPGRNQPGTGEIRYDFVLRELDRLGYDGWIGLEYKPTPDPVGSIAWIREMGYTL